VLAAPPVGEEATESDAHKTARRGVEQEPPQKFLGSHSHQPLLAVNGRRRDDQTSVRTRAYVNAEQFGVYLRNGW